MRVLLRQIVILVLVVCSSAAWSGSPVWQLQGSASAFYIAGTIHVLRESDYPLPTALEQAYHASDVVMLEMDLSPQTQDVFRRKMAAIGTLPAGQTLHSVLSPGVLQQVETQLAKDQLPLERVQSLRPWIVALTLMHLELQRNGVKPELGIDLHYYQRAVNDGKTLQVLETDDAQLAVLAGMDAIPADTLMSQFIRDINELPATLQLLTQAWREGDYHAIDERLTDRLREQQPEYYQQILVARNQRWVPLIETAMQSGKPVLVLVGSAHLAGQDSLIRMLEARGHVFSQVQVAADD